MPSGSTQYKLALQGAMNNLTHWEKYSPVSIGIEDMFNRLDAFADHSPNYPPYNIVKIDDITQQLEIALAGFKKEDIEVFTERKVLNINVNKTKESVGEYVHKGLAYRTFSRSWQLSDDTVVTDVTFVDGLLTVTLEKQVPEEHRRKVLPIS